MCKESSEHPPPLKPKLKPKPKPRGALSQPWKQQRAEVQGHFIYLTLLNFFFFFSILFKLKLSKVVPDKSEGCRGSGLSFLLLTTSAKDNTVGGGGTVRQRQGSHQGLSKGALPEDGYQPPYKAMGAGSQGSCLTHVCCGIKGQEESEESPPSPSAPKDF